MIDLDKDIEVLREEDDAVLDVRIIERDLGGEYPLLAVVGEDITDPDDQTIVRFALDDGSSKKGKYTLRNVAESEVELPVHLQHRVVHPKYGPGKVIKVRTHAENSSYVAYDSGAKKWSFDRKLRLAA